MPGGSLPLMRGKEARFLEETRQIKKKEAGGGGSFGGPGAKAAAGRWMSGSRGFERNESDAARRLQPFPQTSGRGDRRIKNKRFCSSSIGIRNNI